MRTVALVGMNGSIDWYCYPHFDSPSVFGAILDDNKGGRFSIHPANEKVTHRQLYWPDTNILVTRFLQTDGIAELEDFMPVGLPPESPWYHHLVRRVRCIRGSVRFSLECTPAFDYGRAKHRLQIHAQGATFSMEQCSLSLSTEVPLQAIANGGVQSEFTLNENESAVFVLRGSFPQDQKEPFAPLTSAPEAEELFQETIRFWHHWLSACTYEGRWRQQVIRSALALKLMTFEPTGAIIASPTASLPEVIGGERNWDYRYTWMRDAAFTVYGLLRIGFKSEAAGFMKWIRDHANDVPPEMPLPPVARIHGGSDISEFFLDHWEGYRGSKPVRIGNDASRQFQNDIYGELLDSLYLYNKYVQPVSYDSWTKVRRRLNWICHHWQLPDEGIWEVREGRQHFVYSKVMNWVALDRGARLAEKRSLPSDKDHWIRVRDQIYEEVMSKGWEETLKCFVQSYCSKNLDASLLIMPLVFFMAPSDNRMIGTLQQILKSPRQGGLVSDGLVYRYTPGSTIDGLVGEEGTFNMCSFWLVEAMTRAGQVDRKWLEEARLLFERMLGYANHLGLYGEQTGSQGEALGNFPQAFTHLSLISSAFNLNRALGGQP
jgi:GH15 family glucan-1,4-alpha-glucosidase